VTAGDGVGESDVVVIDDLVLNRYRKVGKCAAKFGEELDEAPRSGTLIGRRGS